MKDIDLYQKETKKTSCFIEKDNSENLKLNIAILGLGLAGESGEVIELLKKHLGHGHLLDKEKLKKELGDCIWYIVRIADENSLLMSDVLQTNIDKLKIRYPNGFRIKDSIDRKE